MTDWLVDRKHLLLFALAIGVLLSTALWWRSRKRRFIVVTAILAALGLAILLLARFVESDAEQMVRKVREVADAVSAKDLDAAFKNVSEKFDRGGVNKEQFRRFCKATLDAGRVSQVQVWDESVVDLSKPDRIGTVQFRFKVHGSWGETPPNWFARVVFTLDPDGQWRVKSFDHYDSLNQSTTPLPIPGWNAR